MSDMSQQARKHSKEMSLPHATCSAPPLTPKLVPSPYLDCPSWDPGVLNSWWMPRAHCPARGTPGTWSQRVGSGI